MKLNDIFPRNSLSVSDVDKIVYSRDASEFEGQCQAVVWPKKMEEVQNLVHYARRTQNLITIRGAGLSKSGGCIPANSVVADMSKMDKIIKIDIDHVIVEAGVILDDLNKALAKKKKFFPVIPVGHSNCTIGGMVSTNALGLNTYYKRMEDWVIGLQVIDGTGRNMNLGAVPSKAFIGSEGTMGIVCKIKLKILKKPIEKTVSIFKFNTLSALMDKLKILKQQENILEVTYYDEFCSKSIDLGEMMHLVVEFSNDEGIIQDPDEIQNLDEMKEKLQHLLIKRRYSYREDPMMPMENMAKFLYWLRKNSVPCFGYMKNGILNCCFRDYSKLPQEMQGLVERFNGKRHSILPIGLKRKKYLKKEEAEKLVIFKNQYDNMKVLNRGVLVD
jgi:FAD/FMN-containing dehydrogenase